jgi:putative YhbY family RNA-binding protein
MRTLTSAARRALRAKAHHLQPVVIVGTNGLTPAVLHEIDVNLRAHELIKLRVFGDDRDERERLLAQVCADLDAAPVQHLGKTLTLWRPAPEVQPAAPKTPKTTKARKTKAKPAAAPTSRRRAAR